MQKANKYNAILLINKEIGMTSHDVVSKLRKITNQKKIGHTGTLDKAASGLLVVCLGNTTKTSQFISDCDKEYIAEITLGRFSKTYDAEGVDFDSVEQNYSHISKEQIEEVLNKFTGEISQEVPAFSAVHVDGKRLYKSAVQDIDVVLPIREITIYNIELLDFTENKLHVKVSCSKGTYIRSLANDIGKELGCGAYISKLQRTKVGNLNLENALTLSEVAVQVKSDTLHEFLLQFNDVINYASCAVNNDSVNLIYNGLEIKKEFIDKVYDTYMTGDKVAIKDLTGNVLAVCKAELPSSLLTDSNDQKLFSYIRVLN